MYLCAYELNIPNIENLKNELRNYYPNQPASWQGSIYINHNEVGEETLKFYKLFDNGFLNNMRFVKTLSDTDYHPHIDMDTYELDYFDGEIPYSSIRQATINILLGEPAPEYTKFFIDLDVVKYDWQKQGYSEHEKKNLKLVDKHCLNENPTLINTGTWHSMEYTRKKWMAGFHFHPLVSWQGAVEYCRHKGFIIERENTNV